MKHPESILIKNAYYPNGLREIDINSYYNKHKDLILKETSHREIMLSIATDINHQIIKRKISNEFIHLTSENYSSIIHGRVVTIYSTMNHYENFGIIDIDIDNLNIAKSATLEVFNYISKISNNTSIRFTGKTSFHVIVNFKRRQHVDDIRIYLKDKLQYFKDKYTISGKRTPNIVNLDLSINKYRGAYITLNSLSIIGLKCIDISPNAIKTFQPVMVKI